MRRHEHQRAGVEHVRQRARIILRIGRDLREGLVTGRVHESLELAVGHRRAVDPEAVDRHAMGRRFLGIVIGRIPCGTCRRESGPCHRSGLHPIAFRSVRPRRLAAPPSHHSRLPLRAVVPETLRARRVGVVPAHAGARSGACPGDGRCGGHEADGCAGRDGAAPRPVVPTRPRPTHAAAGIAGPHHGRAAAAAPPSGSIAPRVASRSDRAPLRRATARTSITSGLDWPVMACTASERVAPIFNADAGTDVAPVPSVTAQARMTE